MNQLLAAAPALAASPEVRARLRRVLGEELQGRAVIRWICPRCGARTQTRHREEARVDDPRRPPLRHAETMLRQLPSAPVRHWVLTLPRPQRFDFAGDPKREQRLARAFVRAIFADLRARCGRADGACGALVVIHRCGSALDLGLHLHAIVLDGVFVRDEERPRFECLDRRTDGADDLGGVLREVERTLNTTTKAPIAAPEVTALRRVARTRVARSRRVTAEHRRSLARPPDETAATARGLRVFRGEAIGAEDRGALRRLCEYLARPPAARLVIDEVSTDSVTLRLPSQPDGATRATMPTAELAARLAAATPAGAPITTRTYGVLAPRAARLWRLRGEQLELAPRSKDTPASARQRPCAGPAAPRCPRCDAPLRAREVEDAGGGVAWP